LRRQRYLENRKSSKPYKPHKKKDKKIDIKEKEEKIQLLEKRIESYATIKGALERA
jgi:hypothetical protein